MYYTEEIEMNQALPLLEACGLTAPENVDYTAGVFSEAGILTATGSLKGDMIQGIAVNPDYQGEDLTAKVLTHLIQQSKDAQSLYLFTKPQNTLQFTGLGFRVVAKARPYAALLEWGQESVKTYQAELESVSSKLKVKNAVIGALVMNCNPFTSGHRYLIEKAAAQCDHVYILVVEENISRFSFAERFMLVQQGTADFENVTVLSGGRYAVSTLTFPSYFTKEEKVADAHAAMDAELFAKIIAPALHITKRFVGTEPLSPVTRIYNETLKQRLPKQGIEVIEIDRAEIGEAPISASRVRALIDQGGASSWKEIETMVPETTFRYLTQNHRKVTLTELLNSREDRAHYQRQLLEHYGGYLVSMTLNIPGPVKDKPAYRTVLKGGMDRISGLIDETKILYQDIRYKVTGAEGYLCIDSEAFDGLTLKKMAVNIEDTDLTGRLLDIDILTKDGCISRKDMGQSGRRCLLCNEDAKICARSQKHKMEDLLRKIDEIIDDALQVKESEI